MKPCITEQGETSGKRIGAGARGACFTVEIPLTAQAARDPVFASASETEPTAFVRVLVLPVEWEGKRTIAYVDPADAEKPKLQSVRVYLEHRL